jgi:2-keto-3-deoxy-L-rhamnonate aldolase RhmA
MGMIGRVKSPEVRSELEVVRTACLKAGLAIGIFGADAEAAKSFMDQGYSLITVGTDTLFIGKSAQQTLATLRG